MPGDDAAPVGDGYSQLGAVDLAVWSEARHEQGDPGADGHHRVEEPFDLWGVPDELWPRRHDPASEPDPDGLVLAEVQLASAAPQAEKDLSVGDIAHRMAVAPTGLAAGE